MNYLEDIFEIVKRNLVSILAIIFGLTSLVGSFIYVNVRLHNVSDCQECFCEDEFENETDEGDEVSKQLTVDVKGAVKKPGVYTLDDGSKIQDAIEAAGGIGKNGTTVNINLSKKINDEMVVYVFTKDELKKKEMANEVVCEVPKCECETVTITECPPVNGNDQNKNDDTQKPSSDKKVSLNKATLEELLTLDGIGESKAKAIIEYRESNGPFDKVEDIQKVSGIGEVLYEKIKNQLTL